MSDEETKREISRQLDKVLAILDSMRADMRKIIATMERTLARFDTAASEGLTAEKARHLARVHEAMAKEFDG